MASKTVKSWEKKCSDLLVGKKVVDVRYLTDKEAENLGWFEASLVIFFDDNTYIIPSSDDEGNRAGALFTNNDDLPTIPVIRCGT